MRPVVLYARVSTQLQEKERTVDSQVAELKRHIAKNGDLLVKEYVDDGYSGAYLDRPAMNELREALKTDLFEAVYFLAADRIARDSIHQDIIVNEILRYKKRVIINDKDYEKNPENEFALRVFGAVSQFERAKILERTHRGRIHHLRSGHLMPNGHIIYGYRYLRKTPEDRAKLVINDDEAAALRYMFEAYAGGLGLNTLSRSMEEKGIRARKGGSSWNVEIIRRMLKNHTYTGIRYFNRMTREERKPDEPRNKYRKFIDRDRSEWIAVKVPAIIPQGLFDKVQEQLQRAREKYRRPNEKQLLSGIVACGQCGYSYCSVRWHGKLPLTSGELVVRHYTYYQCSMQMWRYLHAKKKRKHCGNAKIATHLLESAVEQTIRDVLLDPEKLSLHIERNAQYVPDESAARELVRIAQQIKKLDESRRRLMDGYAMGRTMTKQYVERSRILDRKAKALAQKKNGVVNNSQGRHGNSMLHIQQYCANTRAQLEACRDTESKRKFLQSHIEQILFDRDKFTIAGSIPAGDSALPFRVSGMIDRKRVRREAGRKGYFAKKRKRELTKV